MHRHLSLVREKPTWLFVGWMVVGAAVSALPFLYEPNGNVAIVAYLTTWMLLGAMAGMLAPERPWRWAVAMAMGPPILGLIRGAAARTDLLLVQLVTLPLLLLTAAPIAAAAYLGRFLTGYRRDAHPARAPGTAARGVPAKAFALSAALSAVAAIVVPNSLVIAAWALVVAGCSGLFAARFGARPLQAASLSVAGAVAGFVLLVVYDSLRGGPDHNLLPFELIFVLVVTIPAGVLASWIGSRVSGKSGETTSV